MATLKNYALLIGIEDYSTYDRSVGQPAGTSNLPGGAADARAFYRQCIAMGFAPENIRVLTSPRFSPADLGPHATEKNVGEATHDAILAALQELVKAIDTETPASGLVTFSGHGMDSQGVVLCPSDTTGSLEQVIRLSAVQDQMGSRKGRQNLTVILDACHSQVGANKDKSLRSQLTSAAKSFSEGIGAERVVSASQRDQVSEYTLFGGEWRGAFTWAFTSAMSQWRTRVAGDVAYLGASYGELLDRTRSLLSALSFKQIPELSGGERMAHLAFLQAGAVPRKTSKGPDQTRLDAQLIPQKYAMLLPALEVQYPFTTIHVNPSQEIWYVDSSQAAAAQSGTGQTLTFNTYPSNEWPTMDPKQWVGQSTATTVAWAEATGDDLNFPAGAVTFTSTGYKYKDADGHEQTGQLSISFNFTTDGEGHTEISQTTWYNPIGSNIDLSLNGGSLSLYQDTSRSYPADGTCYKAVSRMG